MFGDFAQTEHDATPTLRLGRVFVVEAVLEANEFLEEKHAAVVNLFIEHLIAIPATRTHLTITYNVKQRRN